MSESAEITRSKFPLFGVWEASLGGGTERNLAFTPAPTFGGMAQLGRASHCPCEGHGFKPRCPRQSKQTKQMEAIKLFLITLTAFIVIVLGGIATIAAMVLIGTPA